MNKRRPSNNQYFRCSFHFETAPQEQGTLTDIARAITDPAQPAKR